MKQILSQKDVCKITGLSKKTIDRYEIDGLCPKRLRLTERRVGWFKEDIQKWADDLCVGIKRKQDL
jgi:predicted DNA-binding transcriptional regulator AlpA